jgi:hypothetical protein
MRIMEEKELTCRCLDDNYEGDGMSHCVCHVCGHVYRIFRKEGDRWTTSRPKETPPCGR